MSFGDHLEDLRRRIFLSLAVPIPISVVTFFFSDTIFKWLVLPLNKVQVFYDLPTSVQVLSPPEMLVTQIKLSLIVALIISAPWVLWQLWLFISPGLYQREKRFVHLLIPGSALLTISGVALMYYVMLPLMLYVLVGFGTGLKFGPDESILDERIVAVVETPQTIEIRYADPVSPEAGKLWMIWPDMKLYASVLDDKGLVEILEIPSPGSDSIIVQQFHVSRYISFVLILFVGIVVAFQMPLVVLLLGWMGLVDPDWLRKNRKYALIVCAVVSAVITPADAISMLAMLMPLYGLYELGIFLLWIAPAGKVAEGTVFSFLKRRKAATDKLADQSTQPAKPAQPEDAPEPREPEDESNKNQPDGGGDD